MGNPSGPSARLPLIFWGKKERKDTFAFSSKGLQNLRGKDTCRDTEMNSTPSKDTTDDSPQDTKMHKNPLTLNIKYQHYSFKKYPYLPKLGLTIEIRVL